MSTKLPWEPAPSADEDHADVIATLPVGSPKGAVVATVSQDQYEGSGTQRYPWTWSIYNNLRIDDADTVAEGGAVSRQDGILAVYVWLDQSTARDKKGRAIKATLGEPVPAFPDRTKTIKDPTQPATEAQIDFLKKLGQSHDVGMDAEQWAGAVDIWVKAGVMTKGFASEQIEEAKARPKRFKPLTTAVEPGYYSTTGSDGGKQYFVVVKTKDGERTYAKRLVKSGANHWSWEYERGAVAALQGLTPLTIDQASEWGALHGHCIICCKPLTDPESVKRGVGPVCAKRIKK
jgi:Family of unknown function (DUF6011)